MLSLSLGEMHPLLAARGRVMETGNRTSYDTLLPCFDALASNDSGRADL